MTYKQTETLIQKYLNGETSVEEEKLLALEVSRENAPADWKIIAEMLGELTVDEALFDQMMAERKHKSRIMKIWPWVAAACVAALLIVFLAPPKEDSASKPPIAKDERFHAAESRGNARMDYAEARERSVENQTKTKAVEVKATETKEENQNQAAPKPQQVHATKQQVRVSKRITKEKQETLIAEEIEPKSKTDGLIAVEKEDIIPYEDPMMQFAEQTRSLRERGNRVIQRVAANSIPSSNNQLNNL